MTHLAEIAPPAGGTVSRSTDHKGADSTPGLPHVIFVGRTNYSTVFDSIRWRTHAALIRSKLSRTLGYSVQRFAQSRGTLQFSAFFRT